MIKGRDIKRREKDKEKKKQGSEYVNEFYSIHPFC